MLHKWYEKFKMAMNASAPLSYHRLNCVLRKVCGCLIAIATICAAIKISESCRKLRKMF